MNSKYKEIEWNDSHSLEDFLNWFLISGPPIGKIPFNNPVEVTYFNEGKKATMIKWYQKGPFQVQLIITDPDMIVPEHNHPNMDSYEVYGGGQINFYKNGILETKDFTKISAEEDGTAPNRGNFIRVKPNEVHGGIFGSERGIFFSVQKWKNGVIPHDATKDWEGIVYSEEHKSKILDGNVAIMPPSEKHVNLNDNKKEYLK